MTPPDERRFRMRLALVAAAGLAWRLVYLVTAKRDQPLLGDAIWYSAQARVLADGQGFVHPFVGGPAADHPPLTPLVLAPAEWFAPGSVMGQRVVETAFGVATIVLLGLLGRRLAGDRVGLLAAALAAGDANLWMNDGLVMSESVAGLVLAVALLVVYRSAATGAAANGGDGAIGGGAIGSGANGDGDRPRRALAWFALAGALVAVAGLTRAELLGLGPLVLLPLAWRSLRSWRRRAECAGAAAVAGVLVLAPWFAYNQSRFRETVLVSTNDGTLLAGAYCDDAFAGGGIGFWSLRCVEAVPVPPGADQSEASHRQRTAAVDYARDHLGRLPVVMAARVARVWNVYDVRGMAWLNQGEGREPWATWTGATQWWLLLPLAATGAVALHRRRRWVWPLLAPFVLVTVVAALSYGIARLRLPADVTEVVLAAVGLDVIAGRVVAGRRRWAASDA